jgi:hypothetical protein
MALPTRWRKSALSSSSFDFPPSPKSGLCLVFHNQNNPRTASWRARLSSSWLIVWRDELAVSVVVAEDSLSSFLFLWTVPHSQGVSSSGNNDGVSLPSSVTPGLSSSGPAAEGRRERRLLFERRGDSWVKRCARVVGDGGAFGSRRRGDSWAKRCVRVVGDGGAFGSRRREWRLGLRVGMISSREMWCATGTISSLRALLCIGDGMVESLVPLAVYAQNT